MMPEAFSLRTPMPKILFLSHTAALGGAEIVLFHNVCGLAKRGFSVEVVLWNDGPLADQFRAANIPTRVFSMGGALETLKKDGAQTANSGKAALAFSLLRGVFRLRRLIAKSGADIVFCNSLKSDLLGGLAARFAGKTVVWHLHDRIAPDYLSPKTVALFRLAARLLPHKIAAISRSVAQTVPACAAKTRVIHNGTPIPELGDPKLGTARAPFCDSRPTFALVARISPWKGQDVFIEAAAIARERLPDARFQIVGDALFGEADFKAKIELQVRQLGLWHNLEWLGFRRDVPALMDAADCVVHASTLGEPFGMVIIEAMARARPVIASRGGATPEIVTHETDGLLVEMGDAQALADAMIRLAQNPGFARQIARRGRETAQARFSLERTLDEWQTFLEGLK